MFNTFFCVSNILFGVFSMIHFFCVTLDHRFSTGAPRCPYNFFAALKISFLKSQKEMHEKYFFEKKVENRCPRPNNKYE